MPQTPPELAILQSLRSALGAITAGDDYWFSLEDRVYLDRAPAEEAPIAPWIQLETVVTDHDEYDATMSVTCQGAAPCDQTNGTEQGLKLLADMRLAIDQWDSCPENARVGILGDATLLPRDPGSNYSWCTLVVPVTYYEEG